MKHLLLTVLCATGQVGEYAHDFHHDFRDRPLPRGLARQPSKSEFINVEAEGLRITLPKDRKYPGQNGVVTTSVVKGDFEITAAYEVLHADAPDVGFGVGVTLVIQMVKPSQDRAGIYRLVKPKGAQVMYWDRSINLPEKPREFRKGQVPCSAGVVRMRLTRRGSTLTYSWAPGTAGDEFQTIEQCEFGSDDIQTVALNATTTSQPVEVDARILDLRIRSGSKSDPLPVTPPPAPDRRGRRLVWLLTALGVVIVAGAALVVRRFVRRKQTPV